MKKFRTPSAVLVGGALLLAALLPRSARAWFEATSLETSVIVNVSSRTAAPSTLIAATNGSASVRVWCTPFANVNETVLIRSAATGFELSSSTGTARILCSTTSVQALPLVLEDYKGPLYAVANATYTIPVNVIRRR